MRVISGLLLAFAGICAIAYLMIIGLDGQYGLPNVEQALSILARCAIGSFLVAILCRAVGAWRGE